MSSNRAISHIVILLLIIVNILFISINESIATSSWYQTANLTPSDFVPGFTKYFGFSVAVSDNTIVAGAPWDDSQKGSAYVFEKIEGTWIQSAKLIASDGAGGDQFGYSVAIDGDTIVVGAPRDVTGDSGSAYVFVKPVSGWADMTQTALIIRTDYDPSMQSFGYSVSVSGDTIVVGDWGWLLGSGMIYVTVKPDTGWVDTNASSIQFAKLIASDGNLSDALGSHVSISGDTIVAGTGNINNPAYVFVKPAGGWTSGTETAKLTPNVPTQGFGYSSVGISGDTIVVSSAFAAYVYVKPTGGWTSATESARLTASDGVNAGNYLAISDNIIVTVDANKSVLVYVKPETGWIDMTQSPTITGYDSYGRFGESISINNGTIVVGDYTSDSVFVFNTIFPWPMFLPAITNNSLH